MKYNIAFYCKSIPFTDATIQLKTSLGGSESALVMMARELAKRGHSVTVFSEIPEEGHRGLYSGVRWLDFSQMQEMCVGIEWDIFISLRFFDIMNQPVRAKYRAIWNEDILSTPGEFFSALWQVDEIYYVSQWQREQYEEQMPETARQMGYVTKNGVDLEMVDAAIEGIEKQPNKIIYISRPERGLAPLLQIFPKLRQSNPALELYLCRYYSMYEKNPNVKRICDEADRVVQDVEGIHYLGNLNKEELYREIASSMLMVYPGVATFDETSCIAALEAQACRTPMVCSARGGLVETLAQGAGVKVEGDAFTKAYQEAFIEACETLLTSPDDYRWAQDRGRAWVEEFYQYRDIAAEWEVHWDTFFRERLSANPRRIAQNLIHHDDFAAASYLIDSFDLVEHQDEIGSLLEQDCEPEDYATCAIDAETDSTNKRWDYVLAMINDLHPKRILDFACGNGAFAVRLKQAFPESEVVAVDYSKTLLHRAERYAHAQGADVGFRLGSYEAIEGEFDLIFCGEFLEHNVDYDAVIETLEAHLFDDGWMVWTVPTGPMVEYLINPVMRTHRIHWEYNTVWEVFGKKPGFSLTHMIGGITPRGNITGHYAIKHQKGPTGQIDWQKKVLLTRPYQSLSTCLIARDESRHLRKCLESVQWVTDEIVLADLGSRDDTVQIAKSFGARVYELPPRWPEAPSWAPNPGSFEWARNESIAPATGDWILWIDADEELIDAHMMRQYLDTVCYEGYVVRQNHLILDAPNRHDKPIRLLRNGRGYRFYGHIHEHCQKGLNEPIAPVLELPRTEIVHYGYITEARRQDKCKNRNLQLLALDRKLNPDRQLGLVLLAREYLNMVHWELQDWGEMTENAKRYASTIVKIYQESFNDPKHTLYPIAFPIYQAALRYLNVGAPLAIKVELANAKDENALRFLTPAEVSSFLARKAGDMIRECEMRTLFPYVPPEEEETDGRPESQQARKPAGQKEHD